MNEESLSSRSTDLVLANLEWVRGLCHRLVKDAATADDLVQRAWLAARTSRPRDTSAAGVRAWLGGVVRNLVREDARRVVRRLRREREASDSSHEPPTPGDLLARSEQLAEVARTVLELDEPFRRTMLLRWFEGMEPGAIASREGIAVGTVRTRLHRGRDELRRRLDAKHPGGSSHWALALIPIATRAESAVPAASSASASKLVAAALVVAVGGGSAWWYATSDRGDSNEPSTSVVANAEPAPASEEPTAREPRPATPDVLASIPRDHAGARAGAAPAPSVGAESEVAPSVASRSDGGVLRGRVALHDDAPLARVGVDVELESPLDPKDSSGAAEGSAKTDTDGTFTIDGLRPGSYRLSVTWNGDLPVRGSPIFATRSEPHDVVVEAHVIDVTARSDGGDLVRMRSLQMLNVREARDFDGGAMMFRAMLPEQPLHHFAVAPVGSRYVVSAEGLDDEEYFGVFDPKIAPGSAELVLSRSHPAFGSLEVVVESEALPATAKLVEMQAQHADLAIMVTGTYDSGRGGRTSVRHPALLPGRYRFEHALEDAGHVAISNDLIEIDVDAGSSRTVVLDAYVGGVLELVVSTSLPLGRRAFADVTVRSGADWTERSLLTIEEYDGGASMIRGSRALVGGPVATSRPWPVGEYEIRISLEGHATETRTVRLLAGQTERLEVTLDPL